MKDYKRLTERDNCYYDDMTRIDDMGGADILYNRLAELEDKIESGELCDRDEVRKETAKKIIYRLRNLSHVGHLRSELDLLCREYCIEEKKQ